MMREDFIRRQQHICSCLGLFVAVRAFHILPSRSDHEQIFVVIIPTSGEDQKETGTARRKKMILQAILHLTEGCMMREAITRHQNDAYVHFALRALKSKGMVERRQEHPRGHDLTIVSQTDSKGHIKVKHRLCRLRYSLAVSWSCHDIKNLVAVSSASSMGAKPDAVKRSLLYGVDFGGLSLVLDVE